MGIPGILKEIGKGERIALSKLAVEHLEKTRRPLRIAIDAAIWSFQNQAGQGGKNPALRTLFYRLLKLLALPIHPVFVYDGKKKPLLKRGKTVSRYGTNISNETSKKLVQLFQFPHHTAPGEAEAECAFLQRKGIVDVVMSQDADAIMFGSKLTIRDWSKEGTRGNKSPTHVDLLNSNDIKTQTGLDPDAMILVALLSGGDYDAAGVPGFGPGLACEVAKAGFGADLLQLIREKDESGIEEWRERLQHELITNESGYFRTKHKSVNVPKSFPDRTILSYYMEPAVSEVEDLTKLEEKWTNIWDSQLDVVELRQYAAEKFDWQFRLGAYKFIRTTAPPLLAHTLRLRAADKYLRSVEQITEQRRHFLNDGISELRISVLPAEVVGIDLDAEEEGPEADEAAEAFDDAELLNEDGDSNSVANPQTSTQKKKRDPWNPLTTEKMWIAETVVQLGAPTIVEEWHQIQRDLLSVPKKSASRKGGKSKDADKDTKNGSTLHNYFKPSKPNLQKMDTSNSANGSESTIQDCTEASVPKSLQTPKKSIKSKDIIVNPSDLRGIFKQGKGPIPEHQSIENGQKNYSEEPGRSQETAIDIASSPAPIYEKQGNSTADSTTGPTTPRKETGSTEPPSIQDIPNLPESVTQRKKRQTKVIRDKVLSKSPSTSPSKNRSIESFFDKRNRPPEPESRSQEAARSEVSIIPPESSNDPDVKSRRTKIYVMGRESLPGTWKEVKLDELSPTQTKSKRPVRVSYVDLTND